jgi:hypothetical protein
MSTLYTKDGVPLAVQRDAVFNPSGQNFGFIQGDRVYGLDGSDRGTIVGDRLVYHSTESATMSGPRLGSLGMGSVSAHAIGSAIWGDEPNINP